MHLTLAPQLLDTRASLRNRLVELASTADSWSFCVDRIDFSPWNAETWLDLTPHFERVHRAYLGYEPDFLYRHCVQSLYDLDAVRVFDDHEHEIHSCLFWFEFSQECVAVVGSIDVTSADSESTFTLAVATPCERSSPFAESMVRFLDRCERQSLSPSCERVNDNQPDDVASSPLQDPIKFEKVLEDLSLSNEPGITSIPAVQEKQPKPLKRSEDYYSVAHRDFSNLSTHELLEYLTRPLNSSTQKNSEANRAQSRIRQRGSWSTRLTGLYRCPRCIRVVLEPRHREWQEHLWLLLLLRPWQCPHCFNSYLRGIA